MNRIPTPIDKAVEKAKNLKKSYDSYFEEELLAQIAYFLDDCSYRTLSSINGQPISIGKENIANPGERPQYCSKVCIGSNPIYIESTDDLLVDNAPALSAKEIYLGLCNALDSIISKLIAGEKIPGLKVKTRFFARYCLVIDI